MAIRAQAGPAGGRDIISAALSRRTHRAAYLTPLGGAPQAGSPLPVYCLGLADAASAAPLARAIAVGWRYPIVGGANAGLANLEPAEDGYAFAGVSHGAFAARLVQAAYLAEEALGTTDAAYEPRLLEVPALGLAALWLNGPDDRFIPLMEGQPPGTAPLRMIDDMEPVLKAALETRREAPPAAGAAPSN